MNNNAMHNINGVAATAFTVIKSIYEYTFIRQPTESRPWFISIRMQVEQRSVQIKAWECVECVAQIIFMQ